MHKVFLKIGFAHIISDLCVYIYMCNDVYIIVSIHIDNMTLTSKSRPAILKVIAELRKFFKLCHLGPITGLLGIMVTRDQPHCCKLWIDQKAYAIKILSRFNILDCKTVSIPLEPSTHLSKADSPSIPDEVEKMQKVPYIQATGALLYLAMCTWPDIVFAVGMLCHFNACLRPKH